jgi:hypothetical protein
MLITLALEDDPAEIQRAHRLLTQLMADHNRPVTSPGSPSNSSNNTPAQRWWAALSKRIGPEISGMAEAAAQLRSFGAWQDLADKLGVPDGTVRAWHRNAGRSIRRVNTELGTNYQLFSWDISLNKFAMAEEVRAAILGT